MSEQNTEIVGLVSKIDEITKSFQNFATVEKVDAIAKNFERIAEVQKAQKIAEAKHAVYGTQAIYDGIVNSVAKGLVGARHLDSERVGEWVTKANANINSTDSGQGSQFKPTTIDSEVSKLVAQNGLLRSKCHNRPGVVGTLSLNKRNARVTVAGKTRPDAAITKAGTTYTAPTLTTTAVSIITTVEEKLLWDSPFDFIREAINDIVEAASEFEDDLLFKGDGTAAYCSFTGLKSATTGVGGSNLAVSAGTGLTVDDVLNLRLKVDPIVWGGSEYYLHPFTMAGLQTKKASTAGSYFFDIQQSAFVLGGSKLNLTTRMDSTVANTTNPVIYGNLDKAITVGFGRPGEVRILNELYADSSQIGIRYEYDLGAVLLQSTAVGKILCTA